MLLGFVCGCTQVFGIQKTDLVDAPPVIVVDAPAPPVCPPIGTKPVFGPDLYQVPARNCSLYVVDTTGTTAAAMCADPVMGYVLEIGPAGESLVPQTPEPNLAYVV